MLIEQIPFAIPPNIEAGLAAGELFRHGGVVRDSAGRIVTHLEEVPGPKVNEALEVTRKFARANKATLIIGTAAAVVVGGAAIAVTAVKRKEINTLEKQLQTALSAYFNAIVAQNMNAEVIDELDRSLRALRAKTGKQASDLIDGDALDSLIAYSRAFILRNAPDQPEEAEPAQLVSLEDYLAEQKKIFGRAS
ncbi:hypothetical protein NQ024_07960 [Corynebacterium sp. 35RC1]|nr:hypothetical protein [Corynebacterium sp. 35RC1]